VLLLGLLAWVGRDAWSAEGTPSARPTPPASAKRAELWFGGEAPRRAGYGVVAGGGTSITNAWLSVGGSFSWPPKAVAVAGCSSLGTRQL